MSVSREKNYVTGVTDARLDINSSYHIVLPSLPFIPNAFVLKAQILNDTDKLLELNYDMKAWFEMHFSRLSGWNDTKQATFVDSGKVTVDLNSENNKSFEIELVSDYVDDPMRRIPISKFKRKRWAKDMDKLYYFLLIPTKLQTNGGYGQNSGIQANSEVQFLKDDWWKGEIDFDFTDSVYSISSTGWFS